MDRICTRCGEEKELNLFPKKKDCKEGHAWWCKLCYKEYHAAHAKKNREKINARVREYRKNNKDKLDLNQKKYRYGITSEDYNKLFEEQGGVCAVCQQECYRNLCLDHCHETGKVRGLLCNHCNVALGMLKDNRATIENLLKYIERHNDK